MSGCTWLRGLVVGLSVWIAAACVAARDELDAGRLAADVSWLADDAREGRRAGSNGERASAAWIAERLAALGCEPAGTDGYLQPFEVPLPAQDGGGSRVALVEPTAMALFEGSATCTPLFCSAGGTACGRVVFAGYGIALDEVSWNDYAGLDVEGAVVLLVRGTPPHEAPASAEESDPWTGVGAIFHKVMEAKRRGAVAVLLVSHPSAEAQGLLGFDAGQTARAGIPALHVELGKARGLVTELDLRIAALDRGEHLAPSGSHLVVRVEADVARERGRATNVLGILRGSDPTRTVVIGAHFDHLGRGGEGSLAPGSLGEIHNGADDNASGTALALELARALSTHERRGDVLIALWSGEELGLLGSEHWAKEPTLDLAHVRANVNLDMVGRAGNGIVQILGAGTAGNFLPWIVEAAAEAHVDPRVSLSGQGVGGSDHQTFLKREIPALHFFSGVHADYHKPSDDVERFEAEGARRVGELVLALVERIHAEPRLEWIDPPADSQADPDQRTGGFRTRFGSVPEYSFEGPGMLLAGTSAGSPAERAGLLAGDVLVRFGDIEIESVHDLVFALNAHKPGDVVLIKYLRAGREQEVRVTLASAVPLE